jgi:hypothetical protein
MTDDIHRIKCFLIYLNGKKSCSLSEYKGLGLWFFAWRKDALWISNREFVPRLSVFLSFFLSLASVCLLTVGVESYRCILSHSVGILWTSDQLVAETSTWRHTTITTDSYPCPRRDSNPQSQQENSHRPTPQTPRPLFISFVSLRAAEHFHCCVSKACFVTHTQRITSTRPLLCRCPQVAAEYVRRACPGNNGDWWPNSLISFECINQICDIRSLIIGWLVRWLAVFGV